MISSSARLNTLGGIVWSVHQYEPSPIGDRALKGVAVKRPERGLELHDTTLCTCHRGAGSVGVVIRLEHHDLVAGLAR